MTTRVRSKTHVMASRAQSSIPPRFPDEIAAMTGAAMTAAMPVTGVWCSTIIAEAATGDEAGTSVCMACPVASEWMAKTAKSSAARASKETKGDTETGATNRRTARSSVISPTSLPAAQDRAAKCLPSQNTARPSANPECRQDCFLWGAIVTGCSAKDSVRD